MNDCFASVSHLILLLDYRRPVARFALLDDGPVVVLAGGDARTCGANVNTDFIGRGRYSCNGNNSRRKEVFSHRISPDLLTDRNAEVRSSVPLIEQENPQELCTAFH
jgi:hypothetical protein